LDGFSSNLNSFEGDQPFGPPLGVGGIGQALLFEERNKTQHQITAGGEFRVYAEGGLDLLHDGEVRMTLRQVPGEGGVACGRLSLSGHG